ncbi:MAG TPA: hypothetical protein VGK73_19255 [Polyangiaceae bacterium]
MRTHPVLALSFACVLVACGGGQHPSGAAAGTGARGRLLQAGLDDRPVVVRNPRLGDPHAAIAFAVARDASATAAVSVPALLRARLVARGFGNTRVRAHALGYSLETPVRNAAEGRRFVQSLVAALTEALRPGEPGLEAARAAVQALGERRFAGPGEALVASCSGELGLTAPPAWDPRSAAAQEELAAGLRAAHASKASAFAVVGAEEIGRAVSEALASGEAWPSGDAPVDAWPAREDLLADFAPVERRRLSVAVRVGNADSAVATADALGRAQSLLSRRLAALDPPWRIERASAVARPRGACVRVDVLPPDGDPGPSAADVARASAVIGEELRWVHVPTAGGELDEAVLRPTDPGEAAAAAAWRALVGKRAAGPARRLAAYTAKANERGRFDLAAAVAAQREAEARASVELASRAERGQARLFALLASTCGTTGETSADAGEAALVVSALARSAAREGSDVTFEPWIAGDGVGILAHAAPRNPREDARAQAARIGAALGQALAAPRTDSEDVARAREALLDQVGREERRGYSLVLDTLTQGHPSWLEPRGTFGALESAPDGGLGAVLKRFLARPLRLAVLANGPADQAEALRGELERWLRPVRTSVTRCAPQGRWTPKTGEMTLKAVLDTPEGSYLALPFAGFEGRLPLEAAATLLLLNRPGGWLDQTLSDLPGSASARALGGPEAGAILIQIAATDGQEAAAIARVRALFERLATTSVAASDVSFAQRELARVEASERLDPRRRAVELWRGTPPRPALDAARLTRFHAALRQTGALLVSVVPKT